MRLVKVLNEWMYRRKMISPLPLLETLADADYVINPRFIAVGDYIFLAGTKERNDNLYSYRLSHETDSEKIQTESIENKVCLFDYVKSDLQNEAKKISVAIAQNLLKCLRYEFPDVEFVVYLELKYRNSVVIRFHRLRSNELYIDPKCYQQEYDDGLFMMFPE